MAGKAFKAELEAKTGHDLPWFVGGIAGFRGGLTDVVVHLRDFENMKNAANAARGTAQGLLEMAELLDPQKPRQNYTARYQVGRTDTEFGCASLGSIDRDGCRDAEEERRRLEELAVSKGYEVLGWDGDTVHVRLPA